MTDREPTGPYVYQPFSAAADSAWSRAGRLWAVNHPDPLVTVSGLTRAEADAVCQALKDAETSPSTGGEGLGDQPAECE